MQTRARNDLARMFAEELDKAGLAAEAIETFATPRRLALIARGLPLATAAVSEEVKGPRSSAPPQALEGFLRKTGLTQDKLFERDGVWFAVIDKPGQATSMVLGPAVERIVRGFPWPKSMRWGEASASTASLRWVRPLHGIVAMLGDEIVPVEIDGIFSGATTVGHRFHHPGRITLGGASDYAEKLRACHVIVDPEERGAITRERAQALAAEVGLELVEDEGLVAENAGLTEWPVPLLGRFDADYLDVPPEVIQLTARVNQKYFVLRGNEGALANAFICTANIEASDGGAAIIAGNQRVLAARLSDARFFWEQDLKVPLEKQAKKLSQIVFHEKLGTVADKVERVAKLARWLVEQGVVKGADPDLAERAARLAKADLVTGMVGEFPELQGVIGGYLAAAQGEPKEVAEAIRDHYKPVGQGDQVPTAPVTVAVSLADKLDTIATFFVKELLPSGSRDPFALRRAALGVVGLILENQLRLDLSFALTTPMTSLLGREVGMADVEAFHEMLTATERAGFALQTPQQDLVEEAKSRTIAKWEEIYEAQIAPAVARLRVFFADRLTVQQREAGVRHDLIDAVFALGSEDDLVRLLARVRALQAFVETEDGRNLLAGYKRAANILKKEDWDLPRVMATRGEQGMPQTGEEDPLALVEEPAIAAAIAEMALGSPHNANAPAEEQALVAALEAAEPTAAAAVAREDFAGAMGALASLRTPIDAFFDQVTVNDPDKEVRARRLNLLARFRAAVHMVADFSKIEG
ncbi:glycine--tRNA ligase subunit beta [Sphingomonas sp. KRR8]|nr:glycine--tRNA ligase subunit beta [Sphingomonas sp. KRR8]